MTRWNVCGSALGAALSMAVLMLPMTTAIAQDAADADDTSGPTTRSEVLMLVPPDGWELAMHQRNDDMFVIQYVPAGQSIDNWREMVQAQVFFGVTDLPATDFLDNMHAVFADTCNQVHAAPVETMDSRGYAVAQRVLACGRSSYDNLGGVSMFRAIQGRESLYAISRAWRGPAFDPSVLPVPDAVMAEWTDFFTAVRLCDNRNPEALCPQRAAE